MNRSMQKGNKGKLRTGTGLALEGREEVGMMSFTRECLHFIAHVRSSRLVLVFLLSASRI